MQELDDGEGETFLVCHARTGLHHSLRRKILEGHKSRGFKEEKAKGFAGGDPSGGVLGDEGGEEELRMDFGGEGVG